MPDRTGSGSRAATSSTLLRSIVLLLFAARSAVLVPQQRDKVQRGIVAGGHPGLENTRDHALAQRGKRAQQAHSIHLHCTTQTFTCHLLRAAFPSRKKKSERNETLPAAHRCAHLQAAVIIHAQNEISRSPCTTKPRARGVQCTSAANLPGPHHHQLLIAQSVISFAHDHIVCAST